MYIHYWSFALIVLLLLGAHKKIHAMLFASYCLPLEKIFVAETCCSSFIWCECQWLCIQMYTSNRWSSFELFSIYCDVLYVTSLNGKISFFGYWHHFFQAHFVSTSFSLLCKNLLSSVVHIQHLVWQNPHTAYILLLSCLSHYLLFILKRLPYGTSTALHQLLTQMQSTPKALLKYLDANFKSREHGINKN